MEDGPKHAEIVYLERIAKEMKEIRAQMQKVMRYIHDAESEVPENMRRFINYMHDIHSVSYMYEERGLAVPSHIHREMERCDDRLRQLLLELHTDGNTFDQVRRKMAEDPENRWDHTRQLAKPQEPA
jgi:septation ring formation regulator EzrA